MVAPVAWVGVTGRDEPVELGAEAVGEGEIRGDSAEHFETPR
jgi:hypothetical protein